jgi:hypothetical protein
MVQYSPHGPIQTRIVSWRALDPGSRTRTGLGTDGRLEVLLLSTASGKPRECAFTLDANVLGPHASPCKKSFGPVRVTVLPQKIPWCEPFSAIGLGGTARWMRNPNLKQSQDLAIFFAIPPPQGIAFIGFYGLFRLTLGRAPSEFDEARYGRNQTGGRHWMELAFWMLVLFGLKGLAAWLSSYSGVELPSRYRASEPVVGAAVNETLPCHVRRRAAAQLGR